MTTDFTAFVELSVSAVMLYVLLGIVSRAWEEAHQGGRSFTAALCGLVGIAVWLLLLLVVGIAISLAVHRAVGVF